MTDLSPWLLYLQLAACELQGSTRASNNKVECILTAEEQTTLPADATWGPLSLYDTYEDREGKNPTAIDALTVVDALYKEIAQLRSSGASAEIVTEKIRRLYEVEEQVADKIKAEMQHQLSILMQDKLNIAEALRLVDLHEGLKS